MPLYDYKCSKCHHEFEANRRIAERHWDSPCPECQQENSVALIVKPSESPLIVSRVGDNLVSKTDSRFRERLKQIKASHPKSTIDT